MFNVVVVAPLSVRVISAAAAYLYRVWHQATWSRRNTRKIDKEKLVNINISEIDHLYRRVTLVYVDFGFCLSLKINADAITSSVLIRTYNWFWVMWTLAKEIRKLKNRRTLWWTVVVVAVGQMTPGHDDIFTVKGWQITTSNCSTAEYW